MRIAVFGLGYVGAVTAACFSAEGHDVLGVDVQQTKVDLINAGQSPIVEAGLAELMAKGVAAGRIKATTDVEGAVAATDLSLVCVGTPSQRNGNLDLTYVRRVCEQIGHALKGKDKLHMVVLRSTMLPGSMRAVVIPTLEEASGKKAGIGFGICNNPEFLREGTAIADFYNPPKTVVGETAPGAGDALLALYDKVPGAKIRTDIESAEMVKYADNAWHAVKVTFANEIGNICKAVGIDGHTVMDIFCQDTKLNLSRYYMKPGFAFGGSCLPKDVRALTYKGRSLDLDLPLLNSVLESNVHQLERGIAMVAAHGRRKVGILGMAFKAGTDDLRESPVVDLVETLIGKGYDLRIYDRSVNLASIGGANRDYILNHIPHISRLMVSELDQVLDFAETLVIGNGAEEFKSILPRLKPGQVVVDLVRISAERSQPGRYDGICW